MKSKKYQGFIRGKIVELRPLSMEHFQTFFKWSNDKRIRRLMRHELPTPENEIKIWLEGDEKNESIHFEIWNIPDNKLIGDVGLNRIHWRNRSAWLMVMIGELDYWGKGFGSEAIELILRYGFVELNLHKITARIYSPNIGSQKCALKNGMKLESIMKEEIFMDGKYFDANFYSIFDKDWFNLHPKEN